MQLMQFERRWFLTLADAMLPSGVRQGVPGAADVPMSLFLDTFFRESPFETTLGVRAFTWILTLLPLMWRLRTFGGLRPRDQIRFLDKLEGSRFYALREMPGLIKLVACLGWAAQPEVQRALGVSQPDTTPPAWGRV
jgi:hypothetical protein